MPKTVVIIPSRKFSKRLEGKNTRDFCGKPLFQWTLDIAMKLDFVDEVIVATDDEAIVDICIELYLGDEKISIYEDDKAGENGRPTRDIVRDALVGYDVSTTVIWLQPTTPLRTGYQISHAYQVYKDRASFPLISAYIDVKNKSFQHNGGVYIFSLAHALLGKDIVGGEFMCVYFMPKEDSIDIDTLSDFIEAERRMEARLKK